MERVPTSGKEAKGIEAAAFSGVNVFPGETI
jgi:hypothetical protein